MEKNEVDVTCTAVAGKSLSDTELSSREPVMAPYERA